PQRAGARAREDGVEDSGRPICLPAGSWPHAQSRGARRFRRRNLQIPQISSRMTDAPIFAPDAFRLDADEAALIDRTRRFGARVLAPRAAQHDRAATFPIENFRDMHPEGLLGICVPKQHGGSGASFRAYCLAAAELGRYCGATALSWNMHVCSTLW